jgi:hypothetical protein
MPSVVVIQCRHRHTARVGCTLPSDLGEKRVISMYECPAKHSALGSAAVSMILSADVRVSLRDWQRALRVVQGVSARQIAGNVWPRPFPMPLVCPQPDKRGSFARDQTAAFTGKWKLKRAPPNRELFST